ncbi:NADPH-dependent aldehyde reductase-like protein, chloroplastic isoform X1 [Jatropha curcas]|uniref:NADPH-dependent aldehyde reductase-like protein, chloroplastic isoform X1 n=1 Tax=Jatropha curcas TaxID=180498 RepID=UPI0005FAAF9E|nr:NADPH-dependent aldehyde reductase-like protein, chloroplastic isoform X1 [Jatropha curcas]
MAASISNPTNPSSLPLEERVAIVTGASRGIGKAIAVHLASLGAKIVINYASNKEQADVVAKQINSSCSQKDTPKAITVQADISDPAHAKSLFDEAERAFGSQVHVLVNSAGVLDPKYPSIANTSLEDFDRTFSDSLIFSVNTRGAFLCCKEAANRLKRGGGGRIILLSSSMVGGLRPGFGAYAASKAAVETMIKILAKELKGTGITANCVAPGPVATEMYFAGKTEEQIRKNIEESPLGRLGETKDIAPVVGFLATDAGEWINGQVIRVNGGYI